MKKRVELLIIYAVVLALSGCMSLPVPTRFEVKVNAYKRQAVAEPKTKYVIVPIDKSISETDLQFIEYSRYVNYALSHKGFTLARSIDDADLVIFLFYGIGNPQEHQYSYSLPIWGQTGVSSSTTSGSFSSAGNWGSYNAITTYTPTYGVTGYQQYSGSYVTYFRFASLSAVDLAEYKASQKIVELWRTEISSTGYSDDLRRVFPGMIAAASDYVASDTGRQIAVTILENDERVLELRSLNSN